MAEPKKVVDTDTRRANLSFLQLIFPTFLLVLVPSTINGDAFYPLLFKLLLFGYQYYITQSFVKSMYS